MNIQDEHIFKIKQIYPQSIDISRPVIKGLAHDLYIVNTEQNKKFVCRFSQQTIAEHNLYISHLLNSNGIKVPEISLYKFDQEYCEIYPFINGKTLYQRLSEGISNKKIYSIYNQLFEISYKISQIPYNFNQNIKVPLTAKIAIMFCKLLNSGKIALCHTDLNSKNIILDDQDNIRALLDLDSVYPESLAFAFINALREAHHYGYDIRTLETCYNKTYVNSRIFGVNFQAKLYSMLKTFGEMLFSERMLKQILKIKVK